MGGHWFDRGVRNGVNGSRWFCPYVICICLHVDVVALTTDGVDVGLCGLIRVCFCGPTLQLQTVMLIRIVCIQIITYHDRVSVSGMYLHIRTSITNFMFDVSVNSVNTTNLMSLTKIR